MNKKNKTLTRRQWLKSAAAVTAAGALFPQIVPRHVVGGQGFTAPSDTLNVAAIGTGMMGTHNLRSARRAGANIAVLCDVDAAHLAPLQAEFPRATAYTDYRRLLEKEKDLDALIVSTPDHSHAAISIPAMELGKHVYCEKPLTHTLYEARLMTEAARKYKVATQLGNHGHSFNAMREFRDCVQAGTIGEIREIHVVAAQFSYSRIEEIPRLAENHPVPDTLNWDLWLGPVPHRDYHPLYHPGSWRGWRPFGCGMLGDFLCHVLDPSFWTLKLGAPASVRASLDGFDIEKHGDTFPAFAHLQYEFPARGNRPPVTLHWYDGAAARVAPSLYDSEPRDAASGIPQWASGGPAGALLIGDKGKIRHGWQGAMNWRIADDDHMKAYMGDRDRVEDPPWPDNYAHFVDWIQACKGWEPAGSNFEYGGPLTEIALLGNIAHHYPGTKLDWDGARMTFPNQPGANRHLHIKYREGWAL